MIKKPTAAQRALLLSLEEYLHLPVEMGYCGDDPFTEKFALEEALASAGNPQDGFRNCLLALMERKGIEKYSAVYRAAGISKFTFSRIMNFGQDHKPSKETVAALAIGLHCSREEAQELYHAAGFHLGTTDLLDRIIGFFIREQHYSIRDVNYCLDYFGAPLIGERTRDRG